MFTQLTNTLTTLITHMYATTGLAGIVLAMAIESACIPLPSEIVMPLAGVMVANGTILGGVDPWIALLLVALAGAIGNLIGSVTAYAIGYRGGRPLMLKYGRYLLISQHDAEKADRFFQRWGSATAFFSRLLPVVRTYISFPAGIAKMSFVKFCVYTFLGAFPWSLLLAYAGYLLGNHLDTLAPLFHSLDVVILVVLVVLVALYIWRHIRNDRRARAAASAAEVAALHQAAQQTTWPQQSQAQQQWDQGQFPPPQQWEQQQPQQPQWGQEQFQQQWDQNQSQLQQWERQQRNPNQPQ